MQRDEYFRKNESSKRTEMPKLPYQVGNFGNLSVTVVTVNYAVFPVYSLELRSSDLTLTAF